MKIHEYQNSKTILADLGDSEDPAELAAKAGMTLAIQLAQLRELEKCRSRLNFFFALSIIGLVLGLISVIARLG